MVRRLSAMMVLLPQRFVARQNSRHFAQGWTRRALALPSDLRVAVAKWPNIATKNRVPLHRSVSTTEAAVRWALVYRDANHDLLQNW
jgi:hypothetical protein